MVLLLSYPYPFPPPPSTPACCLVPSSCCNNINNHSNNNNRNNHHSNSNHSRRDSNRGRSSNSAMSRWTARWTLPTIPQQPHETVLVPLLLMLLRLLRRRRVVVIARYPAVLLSPVPVQMLVCCRTTEVGPMTTEIARVIIPLLVTYGLD